MQVHRLIAVAAMGGAACFGSNAASARFLQVDPVGYQDQVNLYAYVNNDPVNNSDPTGATCTSSQKGEKTVYACRVDSVAIVKKGESSEAGLQRQLRIRGSLRLTHATRRPLISS